MWATGSEGENEETHSKGLFEKAFKGHNEVVRALLMYGASVDKADKDGITALMYACFHGHADAVQTLLNAGADTSLRNSNGKTAMFLAQSNGHDRVVEVLRQGPNILVVVLKSSDHAHTIRIWRRTREARSQFADGFSASSGKQRGGNMHMSGEQSSRSPMPVHNSLRMDLTALWTLLFPCWSIRLLTR